jgi:uncharacterized protein YqgC (DUF456 family)
VTVLLCSLLVAVGVFGIAVPGLPGTLLVAAAFAIWAAHDGSGGAWTVFAVCVACLLAGAVVKYAVPGRRLKAAVPTRTLVVGGIGALVGFFVIPVVGALLGLPLGVYLAERLRVGPAEAWVSTRAAMGAVGLSILIELAAALLATALWITGVVVT